MTRSPLISGKNKSEAREPEGLVKITYGIVASSLFKRAGNSNYEKIFNCELQHLFTFIALFFYFFKPTVQESTTFLELVVSTGRELAKQA